MERSSGILKRIDWLTVIICIFLVTFGWMNIYAAVYREEAVNILKERYTMQLIWISIAIILIIIVFIVDSRIYEVLAYPIYAFSILLLIAVLIFGKEINGARSWFEFGSLRFQPAEFTKLATTLALARMLSIYDFKVNNPKDLAKVALIIIIPVGLIILQNDTGSALVYSAFIFVLYREGLSPWYLILLLIFAVFFILSLFVDIFYLIAVIPIATLIVFHLIYQNLRYTLIGIYGLLFIGVLLILNHYVLKFRPENLLVLSILFVLVVLAYPAYIKRIRYYNSMLFIVAAAIIFIFSVEYIFNNVLEKHQRTRINVVLGLESDPQGVEYNVRQSKIAIGSGEITGKGFLQGTQTKYEFVPEQDTDFIFCTVGEEWGFLGTFVVLTMFLALIIRIVIIAERQRSKMNRIYAYGVASILFFHVAINIGMTIGLAPVIGIPLPFFSYGGSSLWAFTLLLAIMLRLDATRMDKF
ncbi:MAG: rod shape-determining protein RodA [Bacteroidales bacterium]